jgi:hypothetical protein
LLRTRYGKTITDKGNPLEYYLKTLSSSIQRGKNALKLDEKKNCVIPSGVPNIRNFDPFLKSLLDLCPSEVNNCKGEISIIR